MAETIPPVIVVGNGGHSTVVLDLLRALGVSSAHSSVYAPSELEDGRLPRGPLGELLASRPRDIILAIGDNWRRSELSAKILREFPDTRFPVLTHPDAHVSDSANIRGGAVILGRAWIGPEARIGSHALINTGAIVEHHCTLEDFASLGPGAIMAGRSSVKYGGVLGLGACLLEGRTVGAHAVVGAGSLVTRDIPESVVAVGIPARVQRSRQSYEPYMQGTES